MSYIPAYRLKIFEDVLVLLNYLNLHKVNVWYTSLNMYHVWSSLGIMYRTLIVLLLKNIKLFYILRFLFYLFVYMLKYSLTQTCLNA